MNSTLKQRWPRTRYVLTLTLALLAQLFNACTVIGQDDATDNAVAENAATPGIKLKDNAKPSLNDLPYRLAAIEDSYRRFNIRWHETSETNPDLPTAFKPLWPNHPEILLNYEQSQIGLREWVDHREHCTNGVRTKWNQTLANEKGVFTAANDSPSPVAPVQFETDGEYDYLIPLPFEGISGQHQYGKKRSLLSEYIKVNPSLTSLEWIDDDAKLTIKFADGPVRPRRVEVWLSHKHNWHPIRVRWFHPSSSKNVPFRHEWEVAVFEEIGGTFRVKSGVKRFSLDLRLMSNTSSIAARERLKKLADESEKRNETLPVAYTKMWAIDAASYGDDVKAPLTWIEVDENPHPPAETIGDDHTRVPDNNDPIASTAPPGEVDFPAPVFPQAPESDAVDEISERLIPLILELADLRTKLGNSHPKVVSLERRVAFTKDYLKKLQRPEVPRPATAQLKIFNLKNSNANDIQLIIAQLFDGTAITISVDNRTNALIVRADESQLREIEAILLRLDSTETAARNSVSTDLPSIAANEPIISIAEYRRRLDALEQPVQQLAEQVRAAEAAHGKDHPDSAKLRADLRALVEQTFAARQEIQRAELAEFNRRLQRMQDSIDTRDRIAEKIADRRVEELLDPNIRWTTTTPAVAPLVSRDELVAELNMKTIEVDQGAIQETTQSPEPSWLELLPTIDAILDDIEDLQKRTPLKLLMQFKDKPLIQISDDFNESFRNLREIVEGNQPPEKVKEGFAATEESSKIFISNFRRFNSEGMINALREIEDGIATLKILIDSDQRIGVLPGLRVSNAALLQKLQGKWAIKESASGTTNDSLVERVAPMGEVHIEGRLITVPFVKGDAPTDIPMLMELQAPGNPQGVKITIDPNGEAFVALGIIECDGDHLRLCFGQCVGKGEIPDETSRPLVFAPGSSAAFLKCGRISTESNAFFPASSWGPRSDAEKSIARLVLVFNRDQTKRVPAVMIQHGNETIAVTAGPATIVPDDVPPAIDREFLEFYDRDDVATKYTDFSTSDLYITITNEELTEFRLEDRVTLHEGDVLAAILMHGQEDFEVTPNIARVSAVEQETTLELADHNIKHQYTGLVQIDQRPPEGTPLFKDGKLAGLTLLGTRFMKDGVEGSYVVPASRIAEVIGQLKSE